ncbi:unnamed protein product [Closterium sp. NIES-54]
MAADETTDGDDEARRELQKSPLRTGLSFLRTPAKKLSDPEPVVASTEDETRADESGRDLRSPEFCTTTAEPSPPEATAPETEIGDAAGDSANKKRKESSGDSAKQWWRQPSPLYGFGELLDAAAKYMRQEQLKQIEASPYISIRLDESTDKARGKHMIIYVHFMKEGASVCKFLTLLTVDKCDAASLVDVLLTHLDAVGIDLFRIVGINTDGARVMTGTSNGVVARLRQRNPYLVSCHCIAHREALAAKDAAEKVTEFNIIDQAVRNVAEQLSRSSNWHRRFEHLQEYICETNLELQGIHDVRWLSRGEAVKRFAKVLPATIVLLHDFKHALYETVTSFKFHFMLFFLADILAVLNELNAKFQKQQVTCGVLWFNYSSHAHSQVDITVVAGEVSLACRTVGVRYVDCEDRFGNDQSPLLCAFLKKHGNPEHREVTVKGVDQNGEAAEHKSALHERKIPGHKTGGDYYSCKAVCQEFARVCVARLEFRLEDLKNLAGSKLFRPSCYPDDNAQRMKKCREWLGMLDHMFHHCLFGVCFKACERELPLFLHTMDTNHGNMSFHKSLSLMLQSTDYIGAYPNLVQLWQAVAVLPLSTVECERGFSRQNRIKTWKRTCLGDAKLSDLMTAALLPSDGMNWVNVVAVFNARKKRQPAQEFRY